MNDQDLERVLKSVGLREKPPADVEREVREHLRSEWRSVVAERGRRIRQRTYFALAASIVASAVAVWALAPRLAGPGDAVATVALATGDVRVTSGWFDNWHGVAGGQALLEGQTLETGATGRGALALPGGISARVDHGSRLVVAAADRARARARHALCRFRIGAGAARAARCRHADRHREARRHAVRSAAARHQRAGQRARRHDRVAIEPRRRGAERFGRAAHHHERRPRRANFRAGLRHRLGLDARGRPDDRHRGPAARAVPRLGRAGNRPRSRVCLARRPKPRRQASWSMGRSPA